MKERDYAKGNPNANINPEWIIAKVSSYPPCSSERMTAYEA
jgi:hypothetical protein